MNYKIKNIWQKIVAFLKAIINLYKRFNAWYKGLYEGKPWYVKGLLAICTLFATLVLTIIAINTNFLWLFGKSPSLGEIMEPRPYNASYIYSADGKLIGKYYKENRTPVRYEEVDTMFFTLLIDTEDERFYEHHGIDFKGMGGALKDFVVHHRARGASTITQQLVKNMFKMRTSEYNGGLLCYIPGIRMIVTKAKEWILASEIEAFYNKNRILEMYANTVDFGNQAFGIKTAAKTYFNTTPDKLKVEQSAMLVGILKGTSYYNPLNNPKRCLERRNVVLNNALTHGDLEQKDYDRLCKRNLNLKYTPETDVNVQCPYFRLAVVEEMKQWCLQNDIDFYRDGLEIHTSIDTRIQACAEKAVLEQMKVVQQNFDREWGNNPCWVDNEGRVISDFVAKRAESSTIYKQLMAKYNENYDSVNYYMNKKSQVKLFDYKGGHTANMSPLDSIEYMLHKMHCGFIAMDPVTGEVKAWVGDVDYKTWQYDNVRAQHQPGSTFKLFVYSAAMKAGIKPCDMYMDSPLSTPLVDIDLTTGRSRLWSPKNASGRFSNTSMTLRSAFARSNNIIAVKLGNEVGVNNIAQTAFEMGVQSTLTKTPSLALGSSDVNLMELVNAYCTVANDGQPKRPTLVTKIYRTNKKGEKEEIYNSKAFDDPARALSHSQAYCMRKMLEGVCQDAGGTGVGINNYVSNVGIGGKTGTSDNFTDAWFVAVTPRLVCGAWVGGSYRQIHFKSSQGQGGKAALPIVGAFLRRVLAKRELGYLHKYFPSDPDLDRRYFACIGSNTGDNLDIVNDTVLGYDTITPQNSADGSYDSTYYIRRKVHDDIYGPDGQPNENPDNSNERPVAPDIDERVKNAFGKQ